MGDIVGARLCLIYYRDALVSPILIRPRKRMRYDEDNALKDQGNRQGFTAAPLNAMECGKNKSSRPRTTWAEGEARCTARNA